MKYHYCIKVSSYFEKQKDFVRLNLIEHESRHNDTK